MEGISEHNCKKKKKVTHVKTNWQTGKRKVVKGETNLDLLSKVSSFIS